MNPSCSLGFRFVIIATLSAASVLAVPAFPGAEGFGANATGGRGGAVYHVTNLNNSGAGSFRDAVSVAGRTVVFDVGGIISITSPVVVKANLTIAGQTAPGDGVTLYGDRISFSDANNTITRYIRFREGINGDSGTDAVGAASGNLMMFDHVSASWGRDETFSLSGTPSNITLQDCIIGQGLLIHSAGSLMQTSGGVSIFRCLYTDNHMRNPKVKGVNDYQNNVVYNWGSGGGYIPAGDSAGLSSVNVIGNYFIAGPTTGSTKPFSSGNTNFSIFHAGNFQDLDQNGALGGTLITDSSFPTLNIVGTPFNYPAPATLLSAAEAYSYVLGNAGASLRRDHADTYMLTELASLGTSGAHIYSEADIGGVGTLAPGLALNDTDNDGIPDAWEEAMGTNPFAADNNGDLNGDGYTNLENYLNALAPAGVQAATIGGLATDSGSSASDNVTSDTTLVLRGAAAPGAVVTIARLDTGVIGTATADGAGQWTFDYTGTTLADRYYAFHATVDLGGGKVSPPTRALLVKVDTTAAAAPVITSIVASPAIAFNGTAEPGAIVNVTHVGVGVVGTTTADGLGNWSALYSGPALPPGTYSFTATATDLAGNSGAASAPYVVNTALAAPVFTGIVNDSGAAGDRITNDTSLVFNGTSFASAVVSITRVGVGVIGTATASAGGTWTFDYTATALPAGSHSFFATASDGSSSSPASAPFIITIDTTRPVVSSIKRQNPTTAATTASTLVFRVVFSEAVSGVDSADFNLTLASGVTGAIGSCAPVSASVYDVTITGVAGDGTVRLDAKSSGTGVIDVAANAMNTGFTGGQTYTIRLPGSGVWIADDSGLPWSATANWQDAIVANGTGATADFSQQNHDGDILVQLDSARTVGRVVFGDADFTAPALWTLSDSGDAANVLTLAMPSGTPNIQVDAATSPSGDTVDVPAANAFPSTLDLVLAGSSGFTKTGVGTLVIAKPATITGPLTITKGIVQIAPGGSLGPSSVFLSTSQQLRIAGGAFNTTGDVTWNSGTGTGIIVSAGSGNFKRILPSNTRNSFVRVTGGTFTATEIKFPRSGDSESQALAAGILISGGDSTVGTIGLGTDNSWGAMTISGTGHMTVAGPIHVGFQVTSGRGGDVAVSGGEFNSLDASPTGGLILTRNPITDSPARANNPNQIAKFTITGGVSNVARLALGYDATSSAGSATVSLTNGELNLGSGGIVRPGTFTTSVNLNSGLLGAFADWSSTVPMTLAGNITIRAGDALNTPHDITLGGVLSGVGGFTKTGGGTLLLTAENTFTGAIALNAGTLRVTGGLASGGDIALNNGGTIAGNVTANRTVTFNGGGRLTFALGASGVSDKLTLSGALNKGAAGVYEIALTAGSGFAANNTYTLATFASTNFSASDFTATGLPAGYAAAFTVNATSLQLTIVGTPFITSATTAFAVYDTPFSYTITAGNGPTSFDALGLPPGLSVDSATGVISGAPLQTGAFNVTLRATNIAGTGTATLVLTIVPTALTRHGPTIAGSLDGSVQMLLGENATLTGDVSSDLLVPGTPTLRVNGNPTYVAVRDGAGDPAPANYVVTLNGGAVLRYLVRRSDPITMPAVPAPAAPGGTRDVVLNNPNQSAGDFATLRNLTLNGGAGSLAIPPGAYGSFTANGSTSFVLGVAGATTPALYDLQQLTLNGSARLQIVGPVRVRLGASFALSGTAGSAAEPLWLALEIANGGVTLNTGATFRGTIAAPNGRVTLNDAATLLGRVSADQLTIATGGLLDQAP